MNRYKSSEIWISLPDLILNFSLKKPPESIQRFQIDHLIKGIVPVETFSCIHVYCSIRHYPSCPKESSIGYGSLVPVRLFP
ncbi:MULTISPECIES: hypothetical protein [Phocaeicola]|uniref:hypothetical protein n=1 Tax=Phocaeicola TaxID=909656 RepID=UPI0032BF4AD0